CWIDRHVWGLVPFGYHAVNIAMHAGGAILLWRILALPRMPGAWLAAAIFGLHPGHVESVAWITERKNVLSRVFYLASAITYLRFIEFDTDSIGRRSIGLYILSFVLFAGALLSKSVT